jgi:hypothetical protein
MPQAVTAGCKTNPWTVLLEDTLRDLSDLRAEDLEELSARAECMMHATVAENPIRQRLPRPELHEIAGLARQHRLLGAMLHATGANLKALKSAVGEGNSPWAH